MNKEGIVKFTLGNSVDIDECIHSLEAIVPAYDQNIGVHFYGSVALSDLQQKKEVDAAFATLISPALEQLLINHRLLTYFYLVKVIGEKSVLNVHQDWSIVNEEKHRGYNLWIPLSDSTVENGTLYVLKGSHQFPLNIRGANIPPKYLHCFDQLKPHMEAVKVKKRRSLNF